MQALLTYSQFFSKKNNDALFCFHLPGPLQRSLPRLEHEEVAADSSPSPGLHALCD